MKTRTIVGISFGVLFSLNLHALTLKEAVVNTIKTNPSVAERVKNYNATLEDVKIAQEEGWLPTLDYLGGVGNERINNLLTGYKDKSSHIYENSLVLIENIFDGWGTTHRINTHKARVAAAAYNYVEKVNDVSFNIVNYYLQVLRDRKLVEIAKLNIDINEAIKKKIEKLYKAGATTKSDLEKINASLSLAHSNYTIQKSNLLDSLYQFKYYYGKDVDPKDFEDVTFAYTLPRNYEEGRDYAAKHNPSILAQSYNIKVAQEDRLKQMSPYYPKINLEARQSWNKNGGGIDGKDDRFRAMVTVSWNLFHGFSDRERVQKGTSKVSQEIQTKYNLVRKTIEGYDLSWNAYKQNEAQLKHLQKYKKYAVKTLRLLSKEYDLGRRSLLDLLAAQNDLVNAKSQIARTNYNYLFAKYRILDAMGNMVTSVVGDEALVYSNVKFLDDEDSKKDIFPKADFKNNEDFVKKLEENRRTNKSSKQ